MLKIEFHPDSAFHEVRYHRICLFKHFFLLFLVETTTEETEDKTAKELEPTTRPFQFTSSIEKVKDVRPFSKLFITFSIYKSKL